MIARTAALVLALLATAGGRASAEDFVLGVCPAANGAADAYARALCDGEAALRANRVSQALERFRWAAGLARVDAANEMAWAGLAAAHCLAQDADASRRWASHFAQARRLWLGELDCAAADGDPRAALDPYVRSRMCAANLVDDYALLRRSPDAPSAIDLKARLQRAAAGVERACAASFVAAQKARPASASAKVRARKPSTRKTSRKAKSPRPIPGASGTPASPDRGR